jgi:O-antigen ligase
MEFLILIIGIVGLVWGTLLLVRGGLLAGCLVVMLAGTCFSVPFLKLPFGPVPLTIDRLLLVVLIGQYLLWRHWQQRDAKPPAKPELILCLFTAYMAISTLSADWRAQSYQPLSWLIVYFLMPFCVYWIARQATLSERSLLALLGCATLFGVYLAVTSLAEYGELWSLVFPKYIATTATDEKLEFVGRGRGPLLHPIGNGMLLSVCLAATLSLWPRQKRLGRLGLLLVSMLILAGIGCCLTRSVWMSGLLALAVVVGVTLPRQWRLPLLGGGLLLALTIATTNWDRLVAFKRDRNLTAAETAESVHLRPILAAVAWQMFLDRPLFGCGYAQYRSEHVNYLSDRSGDLPLEKGRGYIQHNVLLSLLTQIGLVGLALFLLLMGLWTRDAWRLWRQPSTPFWARQISLVFLLTLGTYFINGMFHDVSVIPMANMTLYFMAGITAGLRPLLEPVAVPIAESQHTLFPPGKSYPPQVVG